MPGTVIVKSHDPAIGYQALLDDTTGEGNRCCIARHRGVSREPEEGVPLANYSGPEVGFGAVTTPSGVFESEVVVHGLAQFLLATQIPLRCLNRYVS